jgi:hypothetical protein
MLGLPRMPIDAWVLHPGIRAGYARPYDRRWIQTQKRADRTRPDRLFFGVPNILKLRSNGPR